VLDRTEHAGNISVVGESITRAVSVTPAACPIYWWQNSVCNPASPGAAPVLFGAPTLNPEFFLDPQATYLETPGFCFRANTIVVIRGKAPVFPNTYLGGSIFQAAFDDQIQVLY
jgi:hypothetical protein